MIKMLRASLKSDTFVEFFVKNAAICASFSLQPLTPGVKWIRVSVGLFLSPSAGRPFPFQVLLYFMPIKKSEADRKDSLTVCSAAVSELRNWNSAENTEQLCSEYSWLHWSTPLLKGRFVKGYVSANKPISQRKTWTFTFRKHKCIIHLRPSTQESSQR